MLVNFWHQIDIVSQNRRAKFVGVGRILFFLLVLLLLVLFVTVYNDNSYQTVAAHLRFESTHWCVSFFEKPLSVAGIYFVYIRYVPIELIFFHIYYLLPLLWHQMVIDL